MTVPQRVFQHLRKNRRVAFCDGCIAKKLGMPGPQQVQPITATLALTPGFTRETGTCQDCYKRKEVIQAN
jgi:hypothetical protein